MVRLMLDSCDNVPSTGQAQLLTHVVWCISPSGQIDARIVHILAWLQDCAVFPLRAFLFDLFCGQSEDGFGAIGLKQRISPAEVAHLEARRGEFMLPNVVLKLIYNDKTRPYGWTTLWIILTCSVVFSWLAMRA